MFTHAETVRLDDAGYLGTDVATYVDGNLYIAKEGEAKCLQLGLLSASTTNAYSKSAQKCLEAWRQAVDQAEILVCENGHWDYPSSAEQVREALIKLVTGQDSHYYVAAFRISTSAQLELYLARCWRDPSRYYKVRFRIIPHEVLVRIVPAQRESGILWPNQDVRYFHCTPTERRPEIQGWDVHLTKRGAPRVREYIGTQANDKPDYCQDWLFAAMTDGRLPIRRYTDVWPLITLQF